MFNFAHFLGFFGGYRCVEGNEGTELRLFIGSMKFDTKIPSFGSVLIDLLTEWKPTHLASEKKKTSERTILQRNQITV